MNIIEPFRKALRRANALLREAVDRAVKNKKELLKIAPDLDISTIETHIDDMVTSGAEYCVFNCPACWDSLAHKVARQGLKPIHMIDLCKLAIGDEQALTVPESVVEV